jgi:DNA-binding transcriptional MerR regulator
MNETPMSRSAARSLVSGSRCRNCHRMTAPLKVSTTESRPNPTSATEEATAPAPMAIVASITASPSDASTISGWTVDQLAAVVQLPVRTIREYQTLGLLPPPRREGRIGRYGPPHVRRLELIARLRERGYSLAGIRDLLGQWGSGADLGKVLGLEPDQLVHLEEPGAPATLDQLRAMLPGLSLDDVADLEATGTLEAAPTGGYCVPSPSLLQLAVDARALGLTFDGVVRLLESVREAADLVADEVVQQIGRMPADLDREAAEAFLQRARGLIGHGVGRLTLHRIGRQLGVEDASQVLQGPG